MVTRTEDHHEKNIERLLILSLVIFLCVFMTFYSGYVLHITTVFSHFFYIPILLASAWWKRKGIPVVFILTFLLLLSYLLTPGPSVTIVDYVRVLVVFVVGLAISLLLQGRDAIPRSLMSDAISGLVALMGKDRVRLILVGLLVAICCMLTIYFHSVLNGGAVFSHFFYIPIILSALWWRKRGLWVAFFLAGFLLLGQVWMEGYIVTTNDYFRALMFIVVPLIISGLEDRITVADRKAHDLDMILTLGHEIIRHVMVESDRRKLAESIARTLATSPNCGMVAITLRGINGEPGETVSIGGNTPWRSGRGGRDRTPACHGDVNVRWECGIKQCPECVGCDAGGRSLSATFPLVHGETDHGTLTVVLAAGDARPRGTIALLKTVADELAYALHNADANSRNRKELEAMVRIRTEELAETNTRLVQEIRQKNSLYAALEKSTRELENFVYTVTHDMKSPLFTMGLCAQRLEKSHGHLLDERGLGYLQQIGRNVLRLENLIRDVLTLSRVGIEFDSTEDVDVNELLDDLSERLGVLTGENDVRLIVHDHLPAIHANRVQAFQVFENLATNAIKYRNRERSAMVEIGMDSVSGGYCHFFVRDNGIGIDSKDRLRIFDEFYRTHDVDVEGSGIGLAIVRKIVEKHGGSVSVTSVRGEGSIFRFSFPECKGD